MNTQPEALRLAAALSHHKFEVPGRFALDLEEAAAELRRLHAEVEALRQENTEDQGVIAVWRGRTERAEAENEALREANEAFAKRQEWWNEKMFQREEQAERDTALLRQVLHALEIGYDSARAEAAQYHTAMAGYRQYRHDQLDADVQQIFNAITALRERLGEKT